MKNTIALAAFLIALGMIVGCSKQPKQTGDQKMQQGAQPGAGAAQPSVAGIVWSIPKGWIQQPQKAMRIATYSVPAPKEGVDAGECGVFYFGGKEGGTVSDNLNRWISQFESGGKHEFSTKELKGFKATLVQISGTYLDPAGPMMESQGKKTNYRLLGAIVEAPQGLVFFKFTGPEATVTAAQQAFDSLVNSIAPAPPPV